MSQENINFGAYPNDINSDAIRTAFEKAQNNFTELYGISASFGVNSVTPGTGVTVSSPAGDVTINANIFNIQLKSQSMVLGPSAFVTTSGSNSTVTITNSGTPITIEMPANITGTSLSVTGNINAGNVVTPGVTMNAEIVSTGNVTAPYFFGNIVGNISGNLAVGGANTQVLFNDNNIANASAGFTFNKTTNAASITGNLTAGNVSATLYVGNLSGTGNSNVGNIGATRFVGNLSGTGNSNVGNLGVTGVFATTLSASGNSNVGNLGATGLLATTLSASGNITANNFVTGNVTIVGSLGTISATGNANVGNLGATSIVGTLTTASQTNITSVGTLGSLSVTGNINAGNIIATLFGSGAALSSITGANVTGTVANATYATSAGSATTATTAGTVTTAAQSNITSVGTLTSLSVSGNVTTGSYIVQSISTGQSATGSTQGTALAVSKSIFEVTTVAAGANGVVLPTAVAGMSVVIMNNGGNSLNVYPATGGQVNSLGTNASFPLGTGGRTTFVATSSTQWYTLTAIYG